MEARRHNGRGEVARRHARTLTTAWRPPRRNNLRQSPMTLGLSFGPTLIPFKATGLILAWPGAQTDWSTKGEDFCPRR